MNKVFFSFFFFLKPIVLSFPLVSFFLFMSETHLSLRASSFFFLSLAFDWRRTSMASGRSAGTRRATGSGRSAGTGRATGSLDSFRPDPTGSVEHTPVYFFICWICWTYAGQIFWVWICWTFAVWIYLGLDLLNVRWSDLLGLDCVCLFCICFWFAVNVWWVVREVGWRRSWWRWRTCAYVRLWRPSGGSFSQRDGGNIEMDGGSFRMDKNNNNNYYNYIRK